MAGAIAWSDERWGAPGELGIPLDDRGLQLADGLFETVLVEEGQPHLLEDHLRRWRCSAALLGMAPPPEQERVTALLAEAMARSGIGGPGAAGALRLNWSRGAKAAGSGDTSRGIDCPGEGEPPLPHRFWLQLTPATPLFAPLSVMISRQERRNAHSLLSRCKTFAYGQAIQARREARRAGADDALLLNSQGDLCCGTTANLLLLQGGYWLTPPLASGCLPGVMRGRALELGLVQEESLEPEHLDHCEAAILINSLGCRSIRSCDGIALPSAGPPAAETLWRDLLRR